ncbi:glycosyltransferase family A protein [Methanolobus mangrovi]|uniref:Glycosyltransferase family A protein n=1 Tax=Methanolobus mangrovi TaxID=3072977 RepID=A0AA51YK27_9EURY|nr:glycosyltransferase family A protein [Methanolobus mangrovi]WMW23240.1 glycosyltransferase family A protein [Methanolobus mangrovi]
MDVSIIVPTFNRKDSLKKTLQSLINQKYPHDKYEIIVCDDGSTDDSADMIHDISTRSDVEIKYITQKNSGPAVARNLGIPLSKGKVIGFIDDDCVAVPCWLYAAVKQFENKNIGGVQGPTLQASKIPLRKKLFHYARTSNVTEQNYFYASCNIFYRKDILDKLGGFDSSFPVPCWGEDTDLGNRVLLDGNIIVFDNQVKVYHDIQYIPFLSYLKSLKKYTSRALLFKKYPFMRKRSILGFIGIRSHVYPFFILFTLLAYSLSKLIGLNDFYFYATGFFTLVLYLWGRIITDLNYKLYPLRIMSSPRYFLIDLIGLYYTLKGDIKYKTLLL